jgi:hypothetical protein
MGEERREEKSMKVFCGKAQRKRPLGKPRRKWEDGIRRDLKDICWGVGWIQLSQDRDRCRAVVNTVMSLRVGRHVVS